MITPPAKNHNNLQPWLNDYFNIIIILILIIFLFLAYYLVLGPKFHNTKEAIRTNIRGEEILYASSQKKLAILSNIQKVYKNIKPTDLQKFNTVLPAKYVPERLFGELAEMVNSGGWLVSDIKFTPISNNAGKSKIEKARALAAANRSGLKKIKLSLSVSAIDYPGLKRLLHLLENNLRLMDVNKLNFSPTAHTAVLDLSTYYYKTAQ